MGLLVTAGLREIVSMTYEINVQDEAKGVYHRYGLGGMLRSMVRGVSLFPRNPAYRKFVKDVRQDGIAPDNLNEYFGYGIYVGRKQ